MKLAEYRKNYLENVKISAAAEGESTTATFVKTVLDDFVESNIIPDYELSYASNRYGRKKYRVDASAFDDFDYSMSIFIADYSGDEEIPTLTRNDALGCYERIHTFVDGCINGHLEEELEISTPANDLADRLSSLKSSIRKFKYVILTDKLLNERTRAFAESDLNGIPVEFNIWDIDRLHRVLGTGNGHEPIEINLKNYTENGLDYLPASDVDADGMTSYLCAVPGELLADLYDKYGSSLLEGNVRSFLSTKAKVNKSIRKTILGVDVDKRMFFALNNGISATASNVQIRKNRILSINNLQIVNGGQTTASLSTARYKDNADLSGIFVQMKLTVIPSDEKARELIPLISAASNNQTKVDSADFFSGHAFNNQMERLSRRIYAPAVNGQQFETHWYFERMRGQYDQSQARMSSDEAKKFELQNPRNQIITIKTLAKYRMIWSGRPYDAVKGAQKNFGLFAPIADKLWEKDSKQFNEQYYMDTVAIGILYQHIDKLILKQDWYDKGYKANIACYTLAYLRYLCQKTAKGADFDLKTIWGQQRKIPNSLNEELVKMTKFVYLHITDENRLITNVTEWTKKEECWKQLKTREYRLSKGVTKMILSNEDVITAKNESRKMHAVVSGIEVQSDVVKKGSLYWMDAIQWGMKKGILTDVEISFLRSATKMDFGRIPTEKQCQRILNIEAKLKDEGFSGGTA